MTAISDRPDVIVVGAGGCGPVVAKELAERGAGVLMLEAGPWLDPSRDYSRLEHDMNGLAQGRFRWGPGDRAKPPWTRRRDNVGLIWQSAGVGGSTLHYNGISTRAFWTSAGHAWPFGYEELLPYYERVEGFLPVLLVSDLATKDALFAAGCERIGLRRSESRDVTSDAWRPCHNAILPIARMAGDAPLRYPDVDGCTMCGHCLSGCPNPIGAPLERKAKRATNVSYVPAAIATGNCEIRPDAFATRVLFDAASGDRPARARGVAWRDQVSGELHEAEADVVVLAGGSIENPRLWLNSGLPNSHDAVGRRLTTHFQDLVTGFFARDVDPFVGQVTMARADLPENGTIFTQGLGPQAFAVAMSTGIGFWDQPTGMPWDTQGRCWGPELSRRMAEYARAISVILSVNDESRPENRVTLADDWPADEHGPVPKVVYYPNATTVRRQEHLARTATEILRAAGARTVHKTNIGVLLTHIMGTMRMGTDPATSVADPDGQAHEVEGLYVGDSSLIPSVGGANPTLTAQALAVRVADRIASRHFA